MFEKIKKFFEKDLWHPSLKDKPASKRFLFRQIKIFMLAIKGFNEDRVQLRASALTYYILLSVVPIFALVFGVAKGLGFEEGLESWIRSRISAPQDAMTWIINFAKGYLVNIKGGFIAGIGSVVLIWSVMKVLGNIESAFNDIWQIKKSRVFARKFSDYISLIVIAPILIFVSSSVTVFLTDQVKSSSETLPLLGYIGPYLSVFVSLIPYILIWLVFTLLYIVMPNTKVFFRSALIAGIIAGTMFQLLQWGYFNFQSLLSGYRAIYGSFAALPLFLLWVYISWLIVLFGAEVSFANQNVEHYESELQSVNISFAMKKKFALLITYIVVKNFIEGSKPLTANEIAKKLDIPVRIANEIVYELLDANILSETITKEVKENAYQPAIDSSNLSVGYVINALDNIGHKHIDLGITPEVKEINSILESLAEELKKSEYNKLLKDL
ncbi:MAG: YihY family inner membrane protein [Bacteroidales bacterium]|nr:YihY family inner membrane protein [Bacteroidales bacterium]